MNLNHLSIFHAVMKAGTISGGAAALHISQPAVSKQLKQFEKEVGLTLFARKPKGVVPTEAGLLLYSYSCRLFALEHEAESAMLELRGLQRGRLRLCASTTIGNYLLPQTLALFRSKYPQIDLELQIGNTRLVREMVETSQVDLGFIEGVVGNTDTGSQVFAEDELVLITHSGDSRRQLTVEQLGRTPLIAREQGSGTRNVMEQALCSLGIRPEISLVIGNTEGIKTAVAQGLGLAVVSRLSVEQDVEYGRLRILKVKGWRLKRPLHLLRPLGNEPGPSAKAFEKLLAEAR